MTSDIIYDEYREDGSKATFLVHCVILQEEPRTADTPRFAAEATDVCVFLIGLVGDDGDDLQLTVDEIRQMQSDLEYRLETDDAFSEQISQQLIERALG